MLGSGLPGGAGPLDSYNQLGRLLTHKQGSRQSSGDQGGVTAWPGPQDECRHWRAQAGGRGRAGGRLAEDCRETCFYVLCLEQEAASALCPADRPPRTWTQGFS